MNKLEQKIEAVIFYQGEPVTKKFLSKFLDTPVSEINEAIQGLKINLQSRGIVLQEKEDELALATSPEFSTLIESLRKEELNKGLTKATLETLSIILYKNGAHRALIDYIRGVNSSFTLRALLIRGLIEKTIDPNDSRKYIYKPTFELLSFMGVSNIQDLPDYSQINDSINKTESEMSENDETTT